MSYVAGSPGSRRTMLNAQGGSVSYEAGALSSPSTAPPTLGKTYQGSLDYSFSSAAPTAGPTGAPTWLPTPDPSLAPSPSPSLAPSPGPSPAPSLPPTAAPKCLSRWCATPIPGSARVETISVQYKVFIKDSYSRLHDGIYVGGQQSHGIPWDDAAEMCARRGMALATVRTEAEQAAVAQALASRMAWDMRHNPDGAEYTRMWLGAKRDFTRNYWHWMMDGAPVWEQNYTNWGGNFLGYSNNVPPDNLWSGNDKLSYLCLNVFNLRWMNCPKYDHSVFAYGKLSALRFLSSRLFLFLNSPNLFDLLWLLFVLEICAPSSLQNLQTSLRGAEWGATAC